MLILSNQALCSIKSLMSRGWWYRIWIIQELFFGAAGKKAAEVVILRGQQKMSWTCLRAAAKQMIGHKEE
jgi:hypothetical protein